MAYLLYSFQDRTTGEIRDIGAPSETAARSSLGGIWTDRDRATTWTACDIGDANKVLAEAMKQERRALDASLAVNPHRPGRQTGSAQMMADFAKAQERHRQAKSRVRELMRMIGALE
jgi:hypothetical protein